jgi:peptidylprolyl isomerase
VRSQENYVVQWADPDEKRELKTAKKIWSRNLQCLIPHNCHSPVCRMRMVMRRRWGMRMALPQAEILRRAERGWHIVMPALVLHGNESNSGSGTSLYVVTGHAPRQLDRNITVVGRVMQGMELLTTLPRGTGALGFYEKPEQRTPIVAMKVAADVPEAERSKLEIIRTESATFKAIVAAQRNRGGEWYKVPPDI